MLGREIGGIRRKDPDPAERPQRPFDERQLQEARGEDRHRELACEILLEEDHEPAGGGEGLHPFPHQFPPGRDERPQQGRVPLGDEALQGCSSHRAAEHREGESGGVADITGDTLDAGIHHQDADRGRDRRGILRKHAFF